MEAVGDRLRYLIDYQLDSQKITLKEFCNKHSIHYTGLISILNKERELGMKVLLQLKAAIPTLSADWVLWGETSKKDIPEDILILQEPKATYEVKEDEMMDMLLKVLQKPEAQKVIHNILGKGDGKKGK